MPVGLKQLAPDPRMLTDLARIAKYVKALPTIVSDLSSVPPNLIASKKVAEDLGKKTGIESGEVAKTIFMVYNLLSLQEDYESSVGQLLED